MRNPRANTIALLEALDSGMLDKDYVIEAAQNFLSDADVKQMCQANDIELFTDED